MASILDLFPNDIILNVLKFLEFVPDIRSFKLAIGETKSVDELFHFCDDICFENCRYNPISPVTPLRTVKLLQLQSNTVFITVLGEDEPALNCDFLTLKFKVGEKMDFLKIDPSFYSKISGENKKILVQNLKNGDVSLLNIHLKNSSSFQLENCSRLRMKECSVGKSYQKFYFKGLQQLKILGLTNYFFDLLNLDEYPQDVLDIFPVSDKFLQPKPFHLNNWNNQTLTTVRISGMGCLENVNLPNVQSLYLSFEVDMTVSWAQNYNVQVDDVKTSIINNLNVPKLKEFSLAIEKGCPPFISNVYIGKEMQTLSIFYMCDSIETANFDNFDNFNFEPLPKFMELEEHFNCRLYNTQLPDGVTTNAKLGTVQKITYDLQELKASRNINYYTTEFIFTTQCFGLDSVLKVDSSIDMQMGYIHWISIEDTKK